TRARSPSGGIATGAQPSPPRGRQRQDRPADLAAWARGEPGAGTTGTPGSEVRAGETDRPRGRHRAPARPYFYLLEAHGFETWLVNARDVKHLPGRPKTDRLDAVWLCKLAERQVLPAQLRATATDPAA